MIRLRKNSFSPAFFFPNDCNRTALDFDENKGGWQAVVKAISRHSSKDNLSRLVQELARNKEYANVKLASKLRKLATIYVRKNGDNATPKSLIAEKSKFDQKIDNLKMETYRMKNQLNESRNFV